MHRPVLSTTFVLALVGSSLGGPAMGATLPLPGGSDPRIQHLSYHEGDVYELPLSVGIVATIVFDDEATLTSAQIGDSTSWRVERMSNRNMLSLKALDHDGATNLTVTDSEGRIYTFDLKPRSVYEQGTPYRVHFAYPHRDAKRREEKAKLDAQRAEFDALIDGNVDGVVDINRAYTFSGSEALRPTRMFDDGTKTYLAFPKNAPRPAIFLVNPDGTERIVEHRSVEGLLVVDLVGRQFTLRDGEEAICLFNKAYSMGEYDDLAPTEESEQEGWFGLSFSHTPSSEPVRDDR